MNIRNRLLAAAIALAMLGACGDPAQRGVVTSAEFGSDWPFTVTKGRLACERGAVTINLAGRVYALNESAVAQGWRKPEELLAHELSLGAAGKADGKKSTKPLLERGIQLCGPPLVPGG